MYTTLADIKKHLNIDASFNDDDVYLNMLYDVAEKTVQRHICVNLSDLEDGEGVIPSPILHAILLYVGNLYNSRENVAFGGNPSNVPFTYDYLVNLYKNYSDTTSDEFYGDIIDDIARRTQLIDEEPELLLGDEGDVVINNNGKPVMTLKEKAIRRVEETAEIDANGNMKITMERI